MAHNAAMPSALSAALASSMGRLRLVAFIEGISYLVLVGVGMPLKYAMGMPLPVRVLGMTHGVLFIAFCLALLMVLLEARLTFVRSVITFLSSLVPFGTFVIDGYLKRWDAKP